MQHKRDRSIAFLLALVAWLMLFVAVDVRAAEINAIVDTWSWHSSDPGDPAILTSGLDVPSEIIEKYRPRWNEHNRALGLEYVFDTEGWRSSVVLATYTDSWSRETWYGGIGAMYPVVDADGWRVNVGSYALYFRHEGYSIPLDEPGFEWLEYRVPGYRRFAVVPGLHVGYKRVGFNVSMIPPLEDSPWTAVLQLQIKLW